MLLRLLYIFQIAKIHLLQKKLEKTVDNMDFLGQNVYDDKPNLTFFNRQNVEIVRKF